MKPQRRLGAALSALVLALLAGGCGEGGGGGSTGAASEPVDAQALAGDPESGKRVFLRAGCGTCHTFKAAGTTKVVGPNLDLVVATYGEAFIRSSIADPGAYLERIGDEPGSIRGDRPYHATMPSFGAGADTPGQRLTDQQLADVVAFLTHAK
jgi:mono/diheme cytochrome c family protein